MVDEPTPGCKLLEARRGYGHAKHGDVVGDRQQQGTLVGVTGPEHGFNLEGGSARMVEVDRPAVVHDPFEHGQSTDFIGSGTSGAYRRSLLAMEAAANSADEAALRRYADSLATGIEAALPGWVVRCVERIMIAWAAEVPNDVEQEAAEAGQRAATEVGTRVRALLATDVDEQATGPLALVREAVRWPTAVLAAAGVPAVERDPFAERTFPDDVYDLAPASFADLDPTLQDAGIAWGAAKAHVVLARRKVEGLR